MLARVYPFKTAGFIPFDKIPGCLYLYIDSEHWLYVPGNDIDEAEDFLWEHDVIASYDKEGSRHIDYIEAALSSRFYGKMYDLDIFDDGYKDEDTFDGK